MISFVLIIALTWLPPESVLSNTPWEQQRIEIIDTEPTLQDLEWKLRQQEIKERFRILEARSDDR